MKRTIAFVLLFLFIASGSLTVLAENTTNNVADCYKISPAEIEVSSKSAVLMEAESGEIIFSKNEPTSRSRIGNKNYDSSFGNGGYCRRTYFSRLLRSDFGIRRFYGRKPGLSQRG